VGPGGGVGTVKGVDLGLAGTGIAMGVVPLGTANALARNLGIPMDPLEAVRTLLTFEAETVPLGEITWAGGKRYFVVMAGCGPDGALADTLSGAHKARFGRGAYYGQAARLFVTRRWPVFGVEYRLVGSSEWVSTEATAMMASRVPDLGGLFSGLTPLASLRDGFLHVQLLGGPAHVSFPAWFALGRVGVRNPWLTVVDVEEVRCTGVGVKVQVDGEALGELPVSLRVVGGGLRLLMGAGSSR
jgi:diacylglycerol kinase family enzyme